MRKPPDKTLRGFPVLHDESIARSMSIQCWPTTLGLMNENLLLKTM